MGDYSYEIHEMLLEYEDDEDVYPAILSKFLMNKVFSEVANKDTMWAAASVMFVLIYFVFHLKSLFLASFGITIILYSFPITAIFNMGIF